MNTFTDYLQTIGEFGVVKQINHPIVIIDGLPQVKYNEIILFETGQVGEIYGLHKNEVEAMVFAREPIQVGTRAVRTNRLLSVPVGEKLLGHVINPLGQSLSSTDSFIPPTEEREMDTAPPGISKRQRINKQLKTGMVLVDMLIPVGKGQRQLVIGDRKTGKSSFLLTAVKNQIHEGSVAIYAAIARKKNDIKVLEDTFKRDGLLDKVCIVATSSYDSPSMIYLTPYTAMTIAEYFRDRGKDVLVVLDDLTTHARFYREISLLANRFPGRDSYPGDIFYTHAKLLERAGNFKHAEKGDVSITCLPVAETIEGDFTGYITTNLMGMTDGHIFFDTNIAHTGRRPAINTTLSVTRVGRQTQSQLKRSINRELTSFFALFEKMQNFSHFGAELTQTVKDMLHTGDSIYQFFDQTLDLVVPEDIQLILFALLWLRVIDGKEQTFYQMRQNLLEAHENSQNQLLFSQMLSVKTLNEFLAQVSKNKDQLLAIVNKKNQAGVQVTT